MFEASVVIAGLEYAQFTEPQVRYSMSKLLRTLEEDLNDVGYEPSQKMKDELEEFEELLNELSEPKTTEPEEEEEEEEEEDIEDFVEELDEDVDET